MHFFNVRLHLFLLQFKIVQLLFDLNVELEKQKSRLKFIANIIFKKITVRNIKKKMICLEDIEVNNSQMLDLLKVQ